MLLLQLLLLGASLSFWNGVPGAAPSLIAALPPPPWPLNAQHLLFAANVPLLVLLRGWRWKWRGVGVGVGGGGGGMVQYKSGRAKNGPRSRVSVLREKRSGEIKRIECGQPIRSL